MTTLLLKNSIDIDFGFDGFADSYVVIECRFNSNGEEFVAIGMYPTMQVSGGVLDYIKADGTEVTVYTQPNDLSTGYWVNQAYRTVTFVEDVDDDSLLGWLERNKATKQFTRQFTRLYSGGVAYSSNGKRFRRLQTEEYTEPTLTSDFLTFSSPNTFTLGIWNNTKNWDGILEYSTNASEWSEWDGTSDISSSDSGNLYLRGTGNTYITGPSAVHKRWCLTGGDISCNGNIETLLDYQAVTKGEHPTMASGCYEWMFYNCTSLTTSPELPATTLADSCYSYMFYSCIRLTTPPELPATTLANSCYSYMFRNCTRLTTPPKLPATTLADSCYSHMFLGCTRLTTPPELPATTLADSCYNNMFFECTSLTTPPELPATTLADSCYGHMFYECTSLTTPPELPVTTLANRCYYYMFSECASLTTPPELPATTLADSCYEGMFSHCTSLTTPPELPATTLANRCYYNMFLYCASLTTPPELPATTLADSCYFRMFAECTSLTTSPELPATTLADSCYHRMFQNCKGLTTVPKLPATTLADSCYEWMFRSCTNIKLSTIHTGEYQTPYRIPLSGTGTMRNQALEDMFVETGGTFTGTPTINTTYYTSNTVV